MSRAIQFCRIGPSGSPGVSRCKERQQLHEADVPVRFAPDSGMLGEAANLTAWRVSAGCGACRGPRSTGTGRQGARKRRGGEARWGRCRMRR